MTSPLLVNLYPHGFDKEFHGERRPYCWANARMVRYTDDFVILARYMGHRMRDFTAPLLEGRLGLTINREKARVVRLKPAAPGESLDFPGYTFRYDRDRMGRRHRYLNLFPSTLALKKERQKLHEMTGPSKCFKLTRVMIAEIDRHLRGWARYFDQGYSRDAFRQIHFYVRMRLILYCFS